MPVQTLSRREFLAAAGLSTAALLSACAITPTPSNNIFPSPTPYPSPVAPGPYQTNKLILGETAGTTALPNPYTLQDMPISAFDDPGYNTVCKNGQLIPVGELPKQVLAAVYYPYESNVRDHRVPTPNPLSLSKGPYPLLLYAHGFRDPELGCQVASPLNRDFTSVELLLRHVASWGCVCVAPDLSWLPGGYVGTPELQDAFEQRGVVLLAYFNYLAQELNETLFAQQLDYSRVILVGHSTGAGGATVAGGLMAAFGNAPSYGLIAPVGSTISTDVHRLLVLGGGRDTMQGADPMGVFTTGGTPKTLVMIPGANHFGYTDLCDANNICLPYGIGDSAGTISRAEQQLAGGAYLAALVRYNALGDTTMLPYLTGAKVMEGLEALNIQVQSKGFTA